MVMTGGPLITLRMPIAKQPFQADHSRAYSQCHQHLLCVLNAQCTLKEQMLDGEDLKALMSLRMFVARQGKELPPGWKVFTKKRGTSNRVDYHFLSPESLQFR